MKIKYSLAALLVISTLNATEDLGTISVESSTIDDKFDAKSLNVSNTAMISGIEVEEIHAENIANVLNKIPGVTARENEGDSNKILIRGIGAERYMGDKPGVAIVIDGVPVQERAGSVNIDSDNIESIKIIKGGASYLYGNDALSGAVIITTKRPKAKNETFITSEIGSFDYKKLLVRHNASNEDLAIELQGSRKSSDGYWENSDYWANSFNGKVQYYIDETSDITFGADRTKRYENDTGSITASDANGVSQIDTNPESTGEVGYATNYNIELDKFFVTYSKDFENDSNLMTQIYKYKDTTTNDSSAYDTDGDGISDSHYKESYAKTIQDGLKSEYRIDDEKLATMIGIDIARNTEDKNTIYTAAKNGKLAGYIDSDTTFDENIDALYGEIKYAINNKLTASINARLDSIEYNYKDIKDSLSWDKSYNETSYKLGATYKLKENSIIYSNLSTGFRVPTISQLYAGDLAGWGANDINNPNIDTEKTYNYEIGFRKKTDTLNYDIAIFQLDRKDYITTNFGNYASPDGMDTMYDNMGDIQNRGLELSLNNIVNNKISVDFGYTYLSSKYKNYDVYYYEVDTDGDASTDGDTAVGPINNKGNTVPRTSKHTVNLSTNYKVTSNLIFTAEVNYRSSQYADDMNQIKVAGYSVVNFRSKYNTKLNGFPVELFAHINNLMDKQYYMMPRVTGDRNNDGVYDAGDMGLTVNPGRTYLAGLSLKF